MIDDKIDTSNRERLRKHKWLSKEYGYVDLSTMTLNFVLAVKKYWEEIERPRLIKKVDNVIIAVRKMPESQLRGQAIIKNQRRVNVIKMNDDLIAEAIYKLTQ